MNTTFIVLSVLGCGIASVAMLLLFMRLRKLPTRTSNKSQVSIIIPARNEEKNLAKLLPTLKAQSFDPLELIVVDDQSDDATAAIAEAHGCRVFRSGELPPGWKGKPWACQQGADAARGEQLLFLDADLELDPGTLARISAHAETFPDVVISVCPWHRTEKFYEQLSVFFNLLMVGGIGAFTLRGSRATGIGLFGQMMWIPKSIYHMVGGHASVRGAVLENLHLAGLLEKAEVPRHCFIGKGSLRMRMFPEGIGQLCASWSKGFSSGADRTPVFAMTLAAAWISGLMLTSITLLALPFAADSARLFILGSYLWVAVALAILFRKLGSFTFWNALLFPVSLFFYQGLFALSLIRKRGGNPVQWKGRHVA
ncbi:glycosyltransferase [Haloferula chungangensis]|uniref:Glycosyltransferase n=1 Tax=Haloferula chungangensis TaxID=1048331 RepID=A0ABW2L6F9_9BACT